MIEEKLLRELKSAHESGKKIGLVQGSWDLFHLGHLLYIKEAKRLCDFLIVALDSDEKIQKSKGKSRPIIPLKERYKFIEELELADGLVVKNVGEKKWGLIKDIKPDVLIAIKENYSDEEIMKLEEFCGKVAILPRQSQSSTSDKIRKIMISERKEIMEEIDEKLVKTIENMKHRLDLPEVMSEPLSLLFENLKESTDYKVPVAVGCFLNGKWHHGTNQIDLRLSKHDIENRTELFYASVEHAEINMLKKLGDVKELNVPIWTTLYPCDVCIKVLNDKGVKEIFYLEDHPEKNWSKRSHKKAEEYGIKATKIIKPLELVEQKEEVTQVTDVSFKYIDPRNAREQSQLNIMMNMEANGKDPLDPEVIEQEILFKTDSWYVSKNEFPYEGIEQQFLIASLNPVYDINNMSKEMWIDLKNIWKRLVTEYNIPGGALCSRFGETLYSGASLTRVHSHLIVPKKGYKTKFTIGGNEIPKKELHLPNFK